MVMFDYSRRIKEIAKPKCPEPTRRSTRINGGEIAKPKSPEPTRRSTTSPDPDVRSMRNARREAQKTAKSAAMSGTGWYAKPAKPSDPPKPSQPTQPSPATFDPAKLLERTWSQHHFFSEEIKAQAALRAKEVNAQKAADRAARAEAKAAKMKAIRRLQGRQNRRKSRNAVSSSSEAESSEEEKRSGERARAGGIMMNDRLAQDSDETHERFAHRLEMAWRGIEDADERDAAKNRTKDFLTQRKFATARRNMIQLCMMETAWLVELRELSFSRAMELVGTDKERETYAKRKAKPARRGARVKLAAVSAREMAKINREHDQAYRKYFLGAKLTTGITQPLLSRSIKVLRGVAGGVHKVQREDYNKYSREVHRSPNIPPASYLLEPEPLGDARGHVATPMKRGEMIPGKLTPEKLSPAVETTRRDVRDNDSPKDDGDGPPNDDGRDGRDNGPPNGDDGPPEDGDGPPNDDGDDGPPKDGDGPSDDDDGPPEDGDGVDGKYDHLWDGLVLPRGRRRCLSHTASKILLHHIKACENCNDPLRYHEALSVMAAVVRSENPDLDVFFCPKNLTFTSIPRGGRPEEAEPMEHVATWKTFKRWAAGYARVVNHGKTVVTKQPLSLSFARAQVDEDTLIEWFDVYIQMLETGKICERRHGHVLTDERAGSRIWFADETDFFAFHGAKAAVQKRVGSGHQQMTTDQTGKEKFAHYTVMPWMSANGDPGPIQVIRTGSDLDLSLYDFGEWPENIPKPFVFSSGKKSPWQTRFAFCEFLTYHLQWLRTEFKPSDDAPRGIPLAEPVIIVVDALSGCHRWELTMAITSIYNAILIELPPNCTHFLQAPDSELVYGQLKHYARIAVEEARRLRPRISDSDLLRCLLAPVCQRSVWKRKNVVDATIRRGLFPPNLQTIVSNWRKKQKVVEVEGEASIAALEANLAKVLGSPNAQGKERAKFGAIVKALAADIRSRISIQEEARRGDAKIRMERQQNRKQPALNMEGFLELWQMDETQEALEAKKRKATADIEKGKKPAKKPIIKLAADDMLTPMQKEIVDAVKQRMVAYPLVVPAPQAPVTKAKAKAKAKANSKPTTSRRTKRSDEESEESEQSASEESAEPTSDESATSSEEELSLNGLAFAPRKRTSQETHAAKRARQHRPRVAKRASGPDDTVAKRARGKDLYCSAPVFAPVAA